MVDRLAQRGVDVSDLVWDAYRSDTHGWLVSVTFDLDDTISQAQWTFRPSSKSLTAIDGQARWLSETRLTGSVPVVAPTPGRHLSAVGAEVFDVEAFQQPRETSPADSQEATQALLDELDRLRGCEPAGSLMLGIWCKTHRRCRGLQPLRIDLVVHLSRLWTMMLACTCCQLLQRNQWTQPFSPPARPAHALHRRRCLLYLGVLGVRLLCQLVPAVSR